MPPQASLFQPEELYEHFRDNFEYYKNKHEKSRKERLIKEKQERLELNTPVPAVKHNSCHVCNCRFKEGEYKLHIRSSAHAMSVRAHDHIYGEIDSLIADMNTQLVLEKS